MLVCFEGIDAAGKTTLLRNVADRMKDQEVVVTRQPGGTDLGVDIRQLVLHSTHNICGLSEMLLFAADAAQLQDEVVRPAVEAGKLVLCDRGWMTNVFYQKYGRGNLMAEDVYNRVFGTHPPSLIVLVDIDLEVSEERLAHQEADRIESAGRGFFRRVHRAYQSVGDTWNGVKVVRVDGTAPPDVLCNHTMRHISTLIEP